MGVDADCLFGYGVFVDYTINEGSHDEDKIFKYDEDEGLEYDYFKLDKYEKPIIIINEPYSGDWCFIGIDPWSNEPEEMIENLKTVKEDFEKVRQMMLDELPEDHALSKQIKEAKACLQIEPYFS